MDNKRKELTKMFVELLPLLRVSIKASQADVSSTVGISRQTYCAIESSKREISWNTFLALVTFFWVNENSKKVMLARKDFIPQLVSILTYSGMSDDANM